MQASKTPNAARKAQVDARPAAHSCRGRLAATQSGMSTRLDAGLQRRTAS